MVTREKFLPTKASKSRCCLLIGVMICLYLLENASITSFIDSRIFNYIIKPILWIGVAYIVWLLPKVRAKGLLKLRSFLNWWAFNFAVIYIMVSVVAGMIDGFGKSPYSHSPIGIITNIIFIGSMLVGREFIRSFIVNNLTKDEKYLIFILVALFMTITNISLNRFTHLNGKVEIVKFIAQYFAPEFSQNLLVTYLVYLGGALPAIIYLGIVQGFHWLCPILPDLKWITKALIGVLCPVFFLMSMQSIYLEESKEILKREKDKESTISWIITSILSIAIIWFAVGVFPIYPSVIATGSMEPMIKPGDVIIVKKIDGNNVKIGEVIQFRRDNILISHRVIEIKEDDQGKSYRTKGDNNSAPDSDFVKPEQIKGKITYVVPKIGWPTLLMKSKEDIPLEKIVF
ncbi:MAG: signal peptidase I [Marinisporobacter sp.]|nr:signal peptidase I [Marinisporobacter sp.]